MATSSSTSSASSNKVYRVRLINYSDITLEHSKGAYTDGVTMLPSCSDLKDACKALRETVKTIYPVLNIKDLTPAHDGKRFIMPIGDSDDVGAIWRVFECNLNAAGAPVTAVVADYILEEFIVLTGVTTPSADELYKAVEKKVEDSKVLDANIEKKMLENQTKLIEAILNNGEISGVPVEIVNLIKTDYETWTGITPPLKEGKRSAATSLESSKPTKIAKVVKTIDSTDGPKAEKKKSITITATHPSGLSLKVRMDADSDSSKFKDCLSSLISSLPSVETKAAPLPNTFLPTASVRMPMFVDFDILSQVNSYEHSVASFFQDLLKSNPSAHMGPMGAVKPSETSYRSTGNGTRYSVAPAATSAGVAGSTPVGAAQKPKDSRKTFGEAGLRAQSTKDQLKTAIAAAIEKSDNSVNFECAYQKFKDELARYVMDLDTIPIIMYDFAQSVSESHPDTKTKVDKASKADDSVTMLDEFGSMNAKNQLKSWYTRCSNLSQIDYKLACEQGKQIRSLTDADVRDLHSWAVSRPITPLLRNLVGYICQYRLDDIYEAIKCYFGAADSGLNLAKANIRDMLVIKPNVREHYRKELAVVGYAQ
jgi:hypothetical protein